MFNINDCAQNNILFLFDQFLHILPSISHSFNYSFHSPLIQLALSKEFFKFLIKLSVL